MTKLHQTNSVAVNLVDWKYPELARGLVYKTIGDN